MTTSAQLEQYRRWEIPGCMAFQEGNGGLPKIDLRTASSTAEIYLHGAQLTHFQKKGEKPLLFCSQLSRFQADAPIRGGVPIIFPWFGAREDEEVMHGFARLADWDLHEANAIPDGGVSLRFNLPDAPYSATWPSFNAIFAVTITSELKMELIITNTSNAEFVFENCLHTYFNVGDISTVSITGLKGAAYLDKLENFARKNDTADPLRIDSEIDRTYLDTAAPVEIADRALGRKIRITKVGSTSTVVWNPWQAKARQMSDFGHEEYKQMVCVESGNVASNKITLAPGKSSVLQVVLSSAPL